MDVQSSTKTRKTISFRKRGGRAKQTPDKGSAPGSRWGFCPYPLSYRIYGWITLTKMWVPICLYCSNCTKFGQLILRKIIKIVATRCQILRLKCTKFDFGWGSLQRSPRPPSWILGALLLMGGGGQGRWGKGRGGEGRSLSLPKVNFLVTSPSIYHTINGRFVPYLAK